MTPVRPWTWRATRSTPINLFRLERRYADACLIRAPLTVNNLYVGCGNTLSLHPGDVINNYVNLSNASALTVTQTSDQLTGLTFGGASQGNLSLTIAARST